MRRTRLTTLLLAVCASLTIGLVSGRGGSEPAWQETRWESERAFVALDQGWRAVVSVDRARLIYFGAADGRSNLLFAPARRDDAAGWGGHRLWLGPQTTWPGGWPPPKAWEASAATAVAVDGDRLVLALPEAGEGWPTLRREYFWKEHRLHCRAHVSGGSRPAQIIHILQVPPDAVVEATASPAKAAPRGYVQLHLGRNPSPQGFFPDPRHVFEADGNLQLRFLNSREKFGFSPQPLIAAIGSTTLRVSGEESEGAVARVPDEGFTTQVYLGSGASQLIELEQLSPLWTVGGEARFDLVIEARDGK